MTHRLTLALLLTGCGSSSGDSDSSTPGTTITVSSGYLNLCAGSESPSSVGSGPYQLTGTVVEQGLVGADGAPVDTATNKPGHSRCGSLSPRYLTVEDSQGDLWHFGWAVESGAGADLAEALPLAANDPVEIDFIQTVVGYSSQSGLAIRSNGELVAGFVASADLWEPLDGAALGGLTVTQGAAMGQSQEPVGFFDWWSLDFNGDSLSTIDIGQQGTVTVGGTSFVAHALNAQSRPPNAPSTCSDCAASYVAWAVWAE